MPRQPRQRPVSCHFCRVRKLRCSREFPCTNCTSRGRPCPDEFDRDVDVHRPNDIATQQRVASVTPESVPSSSATSVRTDPDILSRLERLEALLAAQNKTPAPVVSAPSAPSYGNESYRRPQSSDQHNQTPPQSSLPASIQNLTEDALLLERSSFIAGYACESILTGSVVFRICPIKLVTQTTTSFIFQNPSAIEPSRCIWLPQREETNTLINLYLDQILFIQHVVHGPALRRLVDEVYDSLQEGLAVNLGAVTLLVSIVTDMSHLWSEDFPQPEVFTSAAEAKAQTRFWARSTLDLIDHAQRIGHCSIECVQAIIIMTFVIGNLEGISVRSRVAIAQGIVMAREIGLHQIDGDILPNQTRRYTGLKAEIGRRVWWYLAASDWLLTRFSGPHEGSYFVHPVQMKVNKPLNIDDCDLTDDREMVGKPNNVPTSVSYFLMRINLAELLRTFAERMPNGPSNCEYDIILELDAGMDRFIENSPEYMRLGPDGLENLSLGLENSIHLTVQRHTMQLFIHSQRCKLHLPFFVRGSFDSAYAYSRSTCLNSASKVFAIETELQKQNHSFARKSPKLAMVLHSVFAASLVVLLDLCLKNNQDKSVSRQHMAHAWGLLENLKAQSSLAARLQDLLRSVMKKHHVPPPASPGDGLPPWVEQTNMVQVSNLPLTPSSSVCRESTTIATPVSGVGMGLASNWANFELDMNLDEIDWNNLLVGFDMPLV